MNVVVDLGGCITDVVVNHHTYGMISAPLDIKSRRDVKRFLDDLAQGVSQPLSSLTEGYHFHHVSAESEEVLDEIQAQLGFAPGPSPPRLPPTSRKRFTITTPIGFHHETEIHDVAHPHHDKHSAPHGHPPHKREADGQKHRNGHKNRKLGL